jgi:MoaA/NifB/PqqE/SkfB family radical SAM enzyme
MIDESPSPYAVTVNASSSRIWRDRSPVLGRLDLELTERCNNNCIHCCINLPEDDDAGKREMSTEEVKRVLVEAAALGALSVRFTGGEPLLRKDFTDLYLFTRKLG